MIKLWCVAKGNEEGWEALCVDLDIAVEGRSFEDARARLNDAIRTYVEDASKEDSATYQALIQRKAPLHVRLAWAWGLFVHALFGKNRNHNLTAGFDLPCPA